ncbi:hypothetical protein [Flavobacterium chungangense]|uniref:Uncharacterized protein n=1 Tax=Flavobacterium chungangense TaxID=554283 RepID=A0A6V6Z952_9FLAO|nr:hypothetical protein [Flavobacterium chungangense]CAD0008321.1 hypothetical protein FLACHUCJ7_03734 [Flavobacterium chungangense]
MAEAGYYYIKYDINNNNKGKFKVVSYSIVTFHDLTKIKDDRFLTYTPVGVYEVVLYDN